jgi:hypothetical protein
VILFMLTLLLFTHSPFIIYAVGTVLAQIADKLSTRNLTLFARTKSRLGRRTGTFIIFKFIFAPMLFLVVSVVLLSLYCLLRFNILLAKCSQIKCWNPATRCTSFPRNIRKRRNHINCLYMQQTQMLAYSACAPQIGCLLLCLALHPRYLMMSPRTLPSLCRVLLLLLYHPFNVRFYTILSRS